MTLRELLTDHGLSAYVHAFEREHVEIADLRDLTADDLRATLGMSALMDRKRFRALVASLTGGSSGTVATAPAPDSGATRVGPPPAAAGATRADSAPSWPAQIGNYRVMGLVGAGGMGTVLRARHAVEAWAEKQGGDMAIKLIHGREAGEQCGPNVGVSGASGPGNRKGHAWRQLVQPCAERPRGEPQQTCSIKGWHNIWLSACENTALTPLLFPIWSSERLRGGAQETQC